MHPSPLTSRLNVWAPDLRNLRNVAAIHRLDLCFGSIQRRDGGYALDAYLDEDRARELADRLTTDGFRCTLGPAQEEEVPEISTTNRYANAVPRGVGRKH